MSLHPHPFDRAMALQSAGEHRFQGRPDAAYANMVGPFGGITAATLLQAVLQHPQRQGDPVALTVNYAGAIADKPFEIEARPLRTNRSTQHWQMLLLQGGEVASSASAVLASRRTTWAATDLQPPQVPPASQVPALPHGAGVAWTERYDLRFVQGDLNDRDTPVDQRDGLSLLWLRDEPPRPLDFAALASICDAFFPRIMVRRPQRVPAGTVSITTHFHADAAGLAAQGTRHLLGRARAAHFGLGFHDQSAEVWGDDGMLLATSHQIVYFKE